MKQAVVTSIGEHAIDLKDPMLILFGTEATDELKKVSIIQEMSETDQLIVLAKNGKLLFDQQEYTITHIGPLANEQLNAIDHVTVVFKEVPQEDTLINAVYVTPFELPEISEGTLITYQ